jgi:hypothetical protein
MLIHRTLRLQRALSCLKIDRFLGQMTIFITVVFIEVWQINKAVVFKTESPFRQTEDVIL